MSIESELFYTFSAIPQTLAGAIGIMGAFVLYKFESIDKDIQKRADEILVQKGINQNDPITFSVMRQAFLNSCMYGEEFAKSRPFNTAWFTDHEQAPIIHKLSRKVDMRRQLIKSALVTASTILISLLILMNVDCLINCKISWLVFTVGFVLSAVSVGSYVYILAYSLVDDEGSTSKISGVIMQSLSKLKPKNKK